MIFQVCFLEIFFFNFFYNFVELPEDADELLERAWNRDAPLGEVFVKAFGIDVTRKDLLSLSGLDWLNDEIINSYMNLIVERSSQRPDLPKVFFVF